MASQSPHRSRKSQVHTANQVSAQNMPSREMSPSPSIRGSTRQLKTQSMPLVPSVMQIYNSINQQQPGQPQQHIDQASPTASQQSKRSPPPVKLHSPPTVRSAEVAANNNNNTSDRITPPPPPVHSLSQSNVHQQNAPVPPQPQHSHSQPNIHQAHPRPINRVPPPQFLSTFHSMEDNWQMTEQLMAEFEQAHGGHGPASGTSGVAYAGGASSSSLNLSRIQSNGSPAPKELDRVRASERMSPKEVENGVRRQRGDSPRGRDRSSQQTASPSSQGSQDHSSEARGSPQYHTPLGTPGEHPATSYTQYRRESYQNMPRIATPPALRKSSANVSPDMMSRATPPMAMKARTPDRDRSLPVQEEPEDDHHHDGESWGGGRDSRTGHRDDDDDDTLIEQDDDQSIHNNGRTRSEDEESYTPRSPSTTLPQEDLHNILYGGQNQNRQPGVLKHSRIGSTDQLGLRGINMDMFDNSVKKKDEARDAGGGRRDDIENQRRYVQEPQHQHHLSAPPQYNSQSTELYPNYGRLHPPQIPHPEDLQNFFDDPASAFIQAYLNSPRPMAPIPPTPHSQTAAPSPSPLISSVQPSPAPPIGSPYPYPFTHVRRSHAYAASPMAASSSYDPNHPSAIQEQLALQMQMYALNNHVPVSESSFSPASTPYPGAGYNPWTYLQASRAFGGRRGDQTQSLQSSPSHEPLSLPMPNIRGRGLKKRERSSNLRSQDKVREKKVHPPPRVESTQPRETTPELTSSGEDTSTAGEERYDVPGVERFALPDEGDWVNGAVNEDDWVDEDDEGEEEDLLELEYHPSYVSNVEKRRRRWETRWEALIQAFQALDRQTDATLVLMASPSHTTKLHAVTSRSIRRDTTLINSPAMASMRSSFKHVASKRRISRANKVSLADRLLSNSGSSAGGSDGSSESREEDLRRALQAALGSLGALGGIYEQREARWREEMRRISDDRETVELLLRQALSINPPNSLVNGNGVGHAL